MKEKDQELSLLNNSYQPWRNKNGGGALCAIQESLNLFEMDTRKEKINHFVWLCDWYYLRSEINFKIYIFNFLELIW
jgi:hypothetical protein